MDLDILSDILSDQPVLTGSLLSNLPNRVLISDASGSKDHPHGIADSQSWKSSQAGAVISKIEDVFESIADCVLEEKKEMVIRLKMRKRSGSKAPTAGESFENDQTRAVKFPSKNPQEAWKFSEHSMPYEQQHLIPD